MSANDERAMLIKEIRRRIERLAGTEHVPDAEKIALAREALQMIEDAGRAKEVQ